MDIITNTNYNNLFNQINYSKISNNIISIALYKIDFITINRFNKLYLNILKYCKKISEKFNLSILLFIHNSIYENKKYMNEINKILNNNILIIKYKFNKNIKSLINLLPLFNFKNNKFNNVFIFDILYYFDYGVKINMNDFKLWIYSYNYYIKNKLDIIFSVYPFTKCHYNFHNYNPIDINKDNLILSSNFFITNHKFNNIIFDKIIKLNKEIENNNFFTFYLYQFIIKLKYGYIEYFNLKHFIYKLQYNLIDIEINNNKTIITNYKNELLKLYQYLFNININTNKINFKQLYKKLYNTFDNNIIKKFYEYLKILNKSKNYKLFDKKTLNYLLLFDNILISYVLNLKNKTIFFNIK